MKDFGNAHLVDRLRDRAEISQDGGERPAASTKFGTLAQGLTPKAKK